MTLRSGTVIKSYMSEYLNMEAAPDFYLRRFFLFYLFMAAYCLIMSPETLYL